MISDLVGSLGARYFLNVTNEKRCFASCAFAFRSSGLITLKYTLTIACFLFSHARDLHARFEARPGKTQH